MDTSNTPKPLVATRNKRLLCTLALGCSSFMAVHQAMAGQWNYDQEPMSEGRAGHTATLMTAGSLKDQVIITGGNVGTQLLDPKHPLLLGKETASVDLYHADGTVTALPSMYFERLYHTATALDDGTLLVAGGTSVDSASTSEVYDPQKGWSRIQVMNEPRNNHTATLLADGEVMVAGGCNPRTDQATATVELFNPKVQRWDMTTPMSTPRCNHTATLLSNGKVLVTGGMSNSGGQLDGTIYLRSTELFDPQTNTWTPGPDMIAGRAAHNATCMDAECSRVMVAGGASLDPHSTNTTPLYQTAEIYDVQTNRWSPAAAMTSPHGDGMAMVRLGNDHVIALGGRFDSNPEVEIYDDSQNRWQTLATDLPGVMRATAVTLANGNVLLSGGTSDWRYHLPSSSLQAVYEQGPDNR